LIIKTRYLTIVLLILWGCITSCAPNFSDQKEHANSDVFAANYPENKLISFDGTIFVATTIPIEELWKSAGWQVSDQAIDSDTQKMPTDCTLYKHEGVANQWIGQCSGNISIPQEGADHIAVIIIHPDGTKTYIQVAPPSNN
jgi:hypothetical protein